MNKLFGLLAILILSATPVFAWPACSGNWISVPTGTSTAHGAVVTENGQTFQCQQPSTPTTGTTSNSASNSNSSSNSSSAANSAANSNSNSSATGGSSSSNSTTGPISVKTGGATASTGPVSATGGAANVSNSGNSNATGGTVSNSGNSSNKNVNTAVGGSGGQGGTASAVSGSSSSSSGSGNTTDISSTTNVAADKFPANTAYAAAPYPTAQCFKGYGAGGQSAAFGFSINGGKIDENCAILETARSFDNVGERLAACKVKISNKYAKKAGVTLEDCMKASEPVAVPQVQTPTPTPTPIIINLPAPVINVAPTPVTIQQMPPVQTPAPAFVVPKPHKKIALPRGSGIKPCPVGYSKTDICLEND